ncbi:MAG: GIY-YIG nuclease family protein [Cyclobacteriaceae bacterium]|nr:GIY-YIG nuclease family protein [Cyclobacteriaceae bacterium]
MYTVYVLYSEKINRFYIGYSENVENRIEYHNNPQHNHIWTKRGIPWVIFLTIDELSHGQARKIEIHIKKMKSTTYLKNLTKYPEIIEKLKSKYR